MKVRALAFTRLVSAFAALTGGCGLSLRTPLTVLIPDGYTGWVRVEYGVPSAPPFETVNGRHVLRIPPSGFARTSSSFEPGIQSDVYDYATPDGKEEPLPAGVTIRESRMFTVNPPAEKQRTFGAFFVGTEASFRAATKDPSSLPVPPVD